MISDAVARLRKTLREIIPATFGWWVEIDHDVQFTVRWIWLGHPAVTHCGSISDSDVTIAIWLLERVDWQSEALRAMDGIELREMELLLAAQQRRKLKLTGSVAMMTLPRVELDLQSEKPLIERRTDLGPAHIPVYRPSLEEMAWRIGPGLRERQKEQRTKREHAIESRRQELEDAMDVVSEEVAQEPAAETEAIPFPKSTDAQDSDFRLHRCKNRGEDNERISEFFSTLREMLEAIKTHPYGTYDTASVNGVRISGVRGVWRMTGKPIPDGLKFRARHQQ